MATTLTIDHCTVSKNSITIAYSGPVESISAQNPNFYTVFDANSVDFAETPAETIQAVASTQPSGSSFKAIPTLSADAKSVTFTFTPSSGKREFHPGDMVTVSITGAVLGQDGGTLAGALTSAQVPGQTPVARGTRDVEDAISYPILTEEVSYRPSPVGIPTTGAGGIGGPGASNLGQRALQAVTDVLGWKANPADPKGFIGALTQSFTLKDVEGHVESTWTPRTYAVQTDLGGGITGAQASLYSRAKDALDQSLSLLDGLYPLDPEADPEYVKALREMARSQMTEIVKELGMVGLPSILRIDTYFQILLGQNPGVLSNTGAPVVFDPDQVLGTLGELRDTYGIEFIGNKFNNSVEDEQDITNFRVISDYMTSLMQSWIANREFFEIKPSIPAFFGTQLVLISRQFNVIAETVNEARFALDSVFIGPNERQTLLLEFHDHSLPAMFLEDVLDEIDKFVADEGPRLLRDGGKISVKNNIVPVVESLKHMIEEAHHPKNEGKLPDGFRTARVQHSLDDLRDQLRALIELTEQVEQDVPPSEDRLIINTVSPPQGSGDGPYSFSIFGNAFDLGCEVAINSTLAVVIAPQNLDFISAQRLDVKNFFVSDMSDPNGCHDVTVTNPSGETATFRNAFCSDGTQITPAPAKATAPPSAKQARLKRNRTLQASVFGRTVASIGANTPTARPAPSTAHSPSTASAPGGGTATAKPTGATHSSSPPSPAANATNVVAIAAGGSTTSSGTPTAPANAPAAPTGGSSGASSSSSPTGNTTTSSAPTPTSGSSSTAGAPTMAHIDALNQRIDDIDRRITTEFNDLRDLIKKKLGK